MLKNARLYVSELERLFVTYEYDPEFQYYYGTNYRDKLSFDGWTRPFVSVRSDDSIIGCMSYQYLPETKVANNFGAINFSKDPKDKIIFAQDLRQMLEDIFLKFGVNVLDFRVIQGNPIEKSYDKLVKRVGGSIVGVLHQRAILLDGSLADSKIYEVTREQYLAYRKDMEEAKKKNRLRIRREKIKKQMAEEVKKAEEAEKAIETLTGYEKRIPVETIPPIDFKSFFKKPVDKWLLE